MKKKPTKAARNPVASRDERESLCNRGGCAYGLMNKDRQGLFRRFAGFLQVLTPAGDWKALGSAPLQSGYVYRVDPGYKFPTRIMEFDVRPTSDAVGRYVINVAGGTQFPVADCDSLVPFKGYKYADGTIRQHFDRANGVPTHVLLAVYD